MLKRKLTREVRVGSLKIGGNNAIVIQSMTDTATSDLASTVGQSGRLFACGSQLVRIATPAIRDAKSLQHIRRQLTEQGYAGPLAADVHFNANVAEMAAAYVEKVRINPGNFVDKSGFPLDSDERLHHAELHKIEEKLRTLVFICRRRKVALRIGVNHGSLSDRILQRYGNTVDGMVESVMEYLRILVKLDFYDVVVSIKSSNPAVMVEANRLLCIRMQEEHMNFPFHLGVTEAGNDGEARIKSAMGIGTLLYEGIGDTIRVSLTEPPENEIPVASEIIRFLDSLVFFPMDDRTEQYPHCIKNELVKQIVGHSFPLVLAGRAECADAGLQPADFTIVEAHAKLPENASNSRLAVSVDHPDYLPGIHFPVMNEKHMAQAFQQKSLFFLEINPASICYELVAQLKELKTAVIILKVRHPDVAGLTKDVVSVFQMHKICNPIVVRIESSEENLMEYQIHKAIQSGPLLLDALPWIQGIWLTNPNFSEDILVEIAFQLLQASRHRMVKTEFIACPGCGRTLFNLQETNRKVKEAVGAISGLKVAVMGCMVNGPGEMADADVGYVGAGKGRISLYQNKELVHKNIPEEDAIPELLSLLRKTGWMQ